MADVEYDHTAESLAVLALLPVDSQREIAESTDLRNWFIALCGGDVQGGYAVAYVRSLGYKVVESDDDPTL